MVALKLVRLIEKHSEELVQGLAERIHMSARMCDFRKIPPAELELAAAEVYRNLGEWLLQKTEDDIESRFGAIAARRAAEGIGLHQFVWALIISRDHLWRFPSTGGFCLQCRGIVWGARVTPDAHSVFRSRGVLRDPGIRQGRTARQRKERFVWRSSVEANTADRNSAFYVAFKEHSMSNFNGVDPLRLRQLRAIAENLCTLANQHRENHNYVVADALYTRALSVAQQIRTPENDGNALVARIRTEQQAAFEIRRAGESGLRETSVGESTEGGLIELIAREIGESTHPKNPTILVANFVWQTCWMQSFLRPALSYHVMKTGLLLTKTYAALVRITVEICMVRRPNARRIGLDEKHSAKM